MDNKVKHLQMIEEVISRLSSNSFKLKGWAVAIVTLVFSLAIKENNHKLILVNLLPLCTFWMLDGIYLSLERQYCQLYKNVMDKEESKIDFNMNLVDVEYLGEEAKRVCIFRCLFSKTIWPLYFVILIVVLVVFIVY